MTTEWRGGGFAALNEESDAQSKGLAGGERAPGLMRLRMKREAARWDFLSWLVVRRARGRFCQNVSPAHSKFNDASPFSHHVFVIFLHCFYPRHLCAGWTALQIVRVKAFPFRYIVFCERQKQRRRLFQFPTIIVARD